MVVLLVFWVHCCVAPRTAVQQVLSVRLLLALHPKSLRSELLVFWALGDLRRRLAVQLQWAFHKNEGWNDPFVEEVPQKRLKARCFVERLPVWYGLERSSRSGAVSSLWHGLRLSNGCGSRSCKGVHAKA